MVGLPSYALLLEYHAASLDYIEALANPLAFKLEVLERIEQRYKKAHDAVRSYKCFG